MMKGVSVMSNNKCIKCDQFLDLVEPEGVPKDAKRCDKCNQVVPDEEKPDISNELSALLTAPDSAFEFYRHRNDETKRAS